MAAEEGHSKKWNENKNHPYTINFINNATGLETLYGIRKHITVLPMSALSYYAAATTTNTTLLLLLLLLLLLRLRYTNTPLLILLICVYLLVYLIYRGESFHVYARWDDDDLQSWYSPYVCLFSLKHFALPERAEISIYGNIIQNASTAVGNCTVRSDARMCTICIVHNSNNMFGNIIYVYLYGCILTCIERYTTLRLNTEL